MSTKVHPVESSSQPSGAANDVWFSFTAARCYAEDERYSTGSGLSVSTQDRAHAEGLFKLYQNERRDETYAIEVRRNDTGEVLMRSGPSMREAERSMNRAWRKRYGGAA